jgi:Transmembrane amino acid transporter protein
MQHYAISCKYAARRQVIPSDDELPQCEGTGLHSSIGLSSRSEQDTSASSSCSTSRFTDDLLSSAPESTVDSHGLKNSKLNSGEIDLHVIRQRVQKDNVTAFVTLLKALFGVSLLSSPRVLGETGLLLGIIVYTFILVACCGSCWCLLQARAKVAASMTTNIPTTIAPPRLRHLHTAQSPVSMNVITYGDLGRELLGTNQSLLINLLIVTLHVSFGGGLVCSSMRQIALVLGWDKEIRNDQNSQDEDEEVVWMAGRWILAVIYFPIICLLLQFRSMKQLFWVCLSGLVIFCVGCLGTMVYSALLVDSNGDGNLIWDVPNDALEWRWGGVPNFVASTLCAMEGINLALPIANSYLASSSSGNESVSDHYQSAMPNRSPVPVVAAAVGVFGLLTMLVATFGYVSGLGGGDGTKHEEGSEDSNPVCPFVAYCLDSVLLSHIHRASMACALTLTLPIILYPSLELVDRWADERFEQLKTGKTLSGQPLDGTWNGFVLGAPPEELRRHLTIEEHLFGREPFFPCLHRNWRYRIIHAAAVCLLGIAEVSWNRGLVLFKGVGLSFACFILPVVLFVRASSLHEVLTQPGLAAALLGLVTLGLVNLVLVMLSVFTDHNFLPAELSDDPLHHHDAEAGHF